MRYSLEILQIITKPVVEPAFLQDWLAFLSQEQEFSVHLLYAPDAFDSTVEGNIAQHFPGVNLHRIERVSPHSVTSQGFVFLADTLDLRYLSHSLKPALVHSHDTRSLLLARFFFGESPRLHSWWMEDRSAHRLWRVSVERLANWRTWETAGGDDPDRGQLGALAARQVPLPTPATLGEEYERGKAFNTMREVYRGILRNVDLRARAFV